MRNYVQLYLFDAFAQPNLNINVYLWGRTNDELAQAVQDAQALITPDTFDINYSGKAWVPLNRDLLTELLAKAGLGVLAGAGGKRPTGYTIEDPGDDTENSFWDKPFVFPTSDGERGNSPHAASGSASKGSGGGSAVVTGRFGGTKITALQYLTALSALIESNIDTRPGGNRTPLQRALRRADTAIKQIIKNLINGIISSAAALAKAKVVLDMLNNG